MPALPARAALALTYLLIACGGDPPTTPNQLVLTSVDIQPDTATLFTVPPGTTVSMSAVGRDQDGNPLDDIDAVEFTSENDAVATVGPDGTVTAVGAGTVGIVATISRSQETKSATATVTVQVPPAAASVQTPNFRFTPAIVDVGAGGSVSWTLSGVPHDVVFTTPNAPENIQPSVGVTVSRAFPSSGVYNYHCLIHFGMNGTVRVH